MLFWIFEIVCRTEFLWQATCIFLAFDCMGALFSLIYPRLSSCSASLHVEIQEARWLHVMVEIALKHPTMQVLFLLRFR